MKVKVAMTNDLSQFSRAMAWLEESIELIPKDIFECLSGSLDILHQLNEKGSLPKKNIGMQIEFLKKMGILSSSEKSASIKEATVGDNLESLDFEKLSKDLIRNKNELTRAHQNTKKSFKEISKLKNEQKIIKGKLEEIKIKKSEIEEHFLKKENLLENSDYSKQQCEEEDDDISEEEFKVPNEPQFEPIAEKMFEEPAAFSSETKIICKLEDVILNSIEGKTKTFYSERTRFHIDFSVVKQKYLVEQVYSFKPENLFTANIPDIGPKGLRVTYDTIAFLVLMVNSYYIPINRLSKMLRSNGNAAFGTASICRYLKIFAECALPIYLHLFDEISETKVLNCDDTSTRTLETMKRIEIQKNDTEQTNIGNKGVFKNNIVLDKELSLFQQVEEKLGFTSKLKNSDGLKKKLNVSCLIGKSIETDYKSYIIFYRTHLGSCGNLIEKLLEIRRPENKILKIQSDLSDTNYPQRFTEKFEIEKFGCLPHSRRAFFKYRQLDLENCDKILHEFKQIAIFEKILKETGLTETYIFTIRFAHIRPCLQKILIICKQMLKKHAPKSELGKAANYFINNYDTIFKYIHHPEIQSSNNISERALRGEKLMLNASKFKKTENGRVIYDICRTLVATCNAAKIPIKEYIVFIMKNKNDVADNPHKYTPYEFAKKHNSGNML